MSAALPAIPVKGANPCQAHGCSACCHDIEMLLTDADLARLRAVAGRDDFWFQAEDGYLQLHTRDGSPAQGSNAAPGATPRPCTFLSDAGSCTVWAARPEGCRLYPAIWDADQVRAELDDDYCPHTDGFLLPAVTGDATRRLAQRLERERSSRLRAA
ncbi:MAG: YkgJ family cysteine cluster protein [Candidatus Thermoplasmatota archaeon]|mgnify:CR=1 FL=1